MSDKGYWFAAGLEARVKHLEFDLWETSKRVERLDDSYRGARFERWKAAVEQAIAALREGASDLRSPLPDTETPVSRRPGGAGRSE